jgi:murein DD-endopeptidase MepM/ murein hydrolase activator NlpD
MATVQDRIRQAAAAAGAADLIPVLLAIARQESNFDPGAVGDGGHSVGVYQEHDRGRGAGLSRAQRSDVEAATRRAIAELRTTQRANPDADPGTVAVLAQRPAEGLRPEYRANVNRSVREFSPEGGSAAAPAAAPPARAAAGGVRRAPSATAQAAAGRARALAAQQGRAAAPTPAAPARTGNAPAGPAQPFDGTYAMPVDGTLTNPFGGAQAYSAGVQGSIGTVNRGADLAAPAGTTVVAPVGGTVVRVYHTKLDDRRGQRDANENSKWGGQVVIKGDDGKEHALSHAQFGSIQVEPGQRVERGQPTHKVGVSGNSTGPHVDWERRGGGGHEDPLASPAIKAAQAAQLYQQRVAQLQAVGGSPASAGAAAPTAAAETTGAGNVSQTAGAATSAAVAAAQTQRTRVQGEIATTRRTIQELLGEQAGLEQRAKGLTGNARADADARLGQLRKQLEGLQEQRTELEQRDDTLGIEIGKAQDAAAGKQLTPDEKTRNDAEVARIRAETDRLRRDLETGGLTPLEAENVRSQIAEREVLLGLRAAAEARQAQEGAATIRQGDARIAIDAAQLPYLIDRTIAQTDLDAAQAAKLNATLQPTVEQLWQDLYRSQQLLPIELESGRMDVDLTRQRAEEIRRTIEPRIQQLEAQGLLDRTNADRIRQTLPYELAQSVATRKLDEARTGLTTAQTGQVTEETRLAKLQADAEGYRQRNRSELERWIRANPDASTEEVNQVMIGLATDYQDWATAYNANLSTQIAKSEQQQATQGLQIQQQTADTGQFAAAERAAAEAEQNRNAAVGNLPDAFGGTANLSGPQGRFAALAAAGQVGGEAGMRGLASASAWGTTELNGVAEGLRTHLENVKRLQGAGPAGGIRQAPTVQAPAGIDVIGFRPPTSDLGAPPPGTATVQNMLPQHVAPPPGADQPVVVSPGSGVQFTPPEASALRRAGRTSTGRIGGV